MAVESEMKPPAKVSVTQVCLQHWLEEILIMYPDMAGCTP